MLENKMKLLREPFAYLLNYVFVHLSGFGLKSAPMFVSPFSLIPDPLFLSL
jgi:hypothetical protein